MFVHILISDGVGMATAHTKYPINFRSDRMIPGATLVDSGEGRRNRDIRFMKKIHLIDELKENF